MLKELRLAVILVAIVAVLTGVAYPLAVTGLAQLVFRNSASGSFIEQDGRMVGSELIGQAFTRPDYFHPRPSAGGYDARRSGGTNAAPSSRALIETIRERTDAVRTDLGQRQIPIAMVTSSGSGLDPHISTAVAYTQAARVARVRNMAEGDLWTLIASQVEDRSLGIFGEPRVNVLKLNIALDALTKEASEAPETAATQENGTEAN